MATAANRYRSNGERINPLRVPHTDRQVPRHALFLPATDLGAIVVREAVARANLEPADIDEVILGNVLSAVPSAPARQAAIRAGLPPRVAALTINKVCGSGLKAVMLAARASAYAEMPMRSWRATKTSCPRWLGAAARGPGALGDRQLIDTLIHDGLSCAFSKKSMGHIADELAQQFDISRNGAGPIRPRKPSPGSGSFQSGCLLRGDRPRERTQRSGNALVRAMKARDRIRISSSSRSSRRPSADGTVTAGNSSLISDGAAAVVVGSDRMAARLGAPARANRRRGHHATIRKRVHDARGSRPPGGGESWAVAR